MRWWVIGLVRVSGCGDNGSAADVADASGSDTVLASQVRETGDTTPDIDRQTTPPPECAVHVDKGGTDSEQCGSVTEPCATITRALSGLEEGCVQVGPGTYSGAHGEVFPLRLVGVELRGAGHDSEDLAGSPPTVIDDSEGTSVEMFDIECPEAETRSHPATIVMEGQSALADVIAKAPLTGTKQFAVLVLNGAAEIHDVRTEGGAEGIYTAGASVVGIQDCQITLAGHAGIKPGGTSQVTIDDCLIWENKDAVEPVCEATTTIRNTEVFCNGNGLEALDRAHTTLVENHVHHNENGIAARGGKAVISMRENVVENNTYGVVMIFASADMGTPDDPGNNTVINSEFAGLMLRNVPETTLAVGNTWMSAVDGTDEAGQYTGDVMLSVSAETCPNTEFSGNIDKAVPVDCTGSGTVTPDPTYQNIVLFNASCGDTPDGGMPTVVLSE